MKQHFKNIFLTYFKYLARIQLKKNSRLIIGITGSAGKTSTLNAITAILKDFRRVKASVKANSESGIPLNILGLRLSNYSFFEWLSLLFLAPLKLLTNWEKYDIYIVEMAIDSPNPPKNMGYLLTILDPIIGVFLNANPMHSELFDPLVSETDSKKRATAITKAIAKEKGKLITGLPKSGTAILNSDDPEVSTFANKTKARVITFGTTNTSQIKFSEINQSLGGTTFTFTYQQNQYQLHFPQYVLPKHFGLTFAAALGVAVSQNIDIKAATTALEKNYVLPKGRASLIPAIHDAYILDSSYNASAEPTIDILDLLDTIAPDKKIALLGDIRELGKETPGEHRRVAKKAAQICDQVLLVGPNMKKYALPVIKKHGTPVEWFGSAQLAAKQLKKDLKPTDVLLVKGSQNTLLLEIAVEALMRNPEHADTLLCRRGNFWNKQRQALIETT